MRTNFPMLKKMIKEWDITWNNSDPVCEKLLQSWCKEEKSKYSGINREQAREENSVQPPESGDFNKNIAFIF